jgi:hypothetical protein
MANAARKGDEGGGARPPLHTIFKCQLSAIAGERHADEHGGEPERRIGRIARTTIAR